ncbi:MAG: helix-turn-helix domain-containing protein [Ruminococcus sp.]|nr:helix-turn-helix domain-containing protein [Ruminococcus sp.]
MNKDYNFNANMYKIVAKNIKKYRELNNMTIKELCEYADIKESFLEKLEQAHDDSKISIYDLYKISVILKTSINKFFEE